MTARDTVSNRIPEWRLQAEAAAGLDELAAAHPGAFSYAASLEGVIGNLNPYQAQLATSTGVKRGEPDLRIYGALARLFFIEMKGERGRLTDSQKERIPILEALGFTVHIVKARTPEEARAAVVALVRRELGL